METSNSIGKNIEFSRIDIKIEQQITKRPMEPTYGDFPEISMSDDRFYSALWRSGIHSRPHTAGGGRPRKRRRGTQRKAQHEVSAGSAALLGHHSGAVLRPLAFGYIPRDIQRHRYVTVNYPDLFTSKISESRDSACLHNTITFFPNMATISWLDAILAHDYLSYVLILSV